jgi:hypothetical protein
MKKASETNEVEILDEAFLHHGGELPWGVFESQRLNPREQIEGAEDGEPEDDLGRGRVLMVLLDLVLSNWGAEMNVERVGLRTRQAAAAVSHRAGRGLPLLGAKLKLSAAGTADDVRRILDWLLMAEPDEVTLGKRVVAVGKFLGHAAFDGWSMSALGRACGETPQAMQERIEAMCEDPLRRSGSRGRAVWQQPDWQREKSREAQERSYQKKKAAKKRGRKAPVKATTKTKGKGKNETGK